MCCCIDLAERINRYQSVNLRCSNRRVPQKFLNDTNVGASAQQVGGAGVTKRVWRDGLGDSGAFRGRANEKKYVLPTERSAPRAEMNTSQPTIRTVTLGDNRRTTRDGMAGL